jgi:NAD(P)H dehydrogenase (quinone)
MFAVMGVTGNVGGAVAKALMDADLSVRAIVRDAKKGDMWKQKGAEIAVADLFDAASLTQAFRGAAGIFVVIPPVFDPAADFAEARAAARSLTEAIENAKPERVVYLSTIGAQARETNLLSQHTLIEGELRKLGLPIAFLRPGWFLENVQWDVTSARKDGVIYSFLAPVERAIPMVATEDIGRMAAELLQERWEGEHVVELEGPERVSPTEIARTFAELLGKPVRVETVAREGWDVAFREQGMQNPVPRMRMLDGFNAGWIDFADPTGVRRGTVTLREVLAKLLRESPRV